MKIKILTAILIVLFLFCLTSCNIRYPELGKDAIAFQAGSFVDENDDSAGYLTIEYNGRTYIPYGTLKGTLTAKDLDKCIGYIVRDENSSFVVNKDDTDTRIYTLTDDPDNNFLMEYYIGTTLMNQPSFFRALDTKGKDIIIPEIVDSLGYHFWE